MRDKRAIAYLKLTNEEKWAHIIRLNRLAVLFNNGKPIKSPQGKGHIFNQKQGGPGK